MLKSNALLTLCLSLLLIPAIPAHGSQPFPSYPVHAPDDYKVHLHQADVSIGVDPVESLPDQTKYFNSPLAAQGFLPVFLVIHNDSKTDSLLLDKSTISTSLGDSSSSGPVQDTGRQKAAFIGTSLIPVLGGWAALGMARDNAAIKQNMILQELQSGTLSPGSTLHGFLYIPIPKKGPRPTVHLTIPIAWSGSGNSSVIPIQF